jgi:uncharacterized membrane protein
MSSFLTEKWLWIIIIALISIALIPFAVLWLLVVLPSPFSVLVTVFLIVGWGIAAGYKDWRIFNKEERRKRG